MDDPKHLRTGLLDLKESLKKVIDNLRNISIGKISLKNINFKLALTSFMILSIIAISFTGYTVNQIRTKAFDVYLGEDKIGTIRDQEEAIKLVEDLKIELSNTYNIDIVLQKELNFEQTHVKDDLLTSHINLKNNVKSTMDFAVSAYVLKVNDEEVGALKTKEELETLINKIKEPYEINLAENTNIKEIKIVENIEIAKKEIPLSKITNEEELYNHLLIGADEIKTHIVEVGESFWTISKIYDISMEDLEAANLDKNPDKLQIGDEVKLIVPTSLVTVATIGEVEYTERINYESQIEYNDNMYKNEKQTKVKGENGLAKIVANEVRHNGVLVEKDIVKEEVIESPIGEIIVKGTKEVPKTMATGAFLMPTRGRISSRYGMRNGSMHKGLDIAASTGTSIKAADGGKVIFSGYRGAYGSMIEIDHGNGYRTRYAHCSKLLVGVGTKVYKGQEIAKMGNTGRSTGPHLHLEVIKNGANQNPANFVN